MYLHVHVKCYNMIITEVRAITCMNDQCTSWSFNKGRLNLSHVYIYDINEIIDWYVGYYCNLCEDSIYSVSSLSDYIAEINV